MSTLPSVLAEVAPIYRALAAPHYEVAGQLLVETRRAFSPSEVDDMELWVIAELLDLNATVASTGGLLSEEEFRRQAEALNAERIRRHQAGLAPPEAPASATPEVTPAMIEALRIRRAAREAESGRTSG